MAKRSVIGDQYGRLLVIAELEPHVTPGGTTLRRFECRCECGSTIPVRLQHLRSGNTKSCGCARSKHGMATSAIYGVWECIIQRCTNPKCPMYPRYGGRGITVCERWLTFENFYADMGDCPSGLSIERINNDGGYCPENCKWATRAEQSRNRSNNRMLTHNGETLCLTDWAERIGIHWTALEGRIERGWSDSDALTIPPLKRGVKYATLNNKATIND